MKSSFTFLRVRGIEIGANWGWFVIAALIAYQLGRGFFPSSYPELDPTTTLVMGIVAALLFFISILLHELGHAFRALKEGMKIEGITLWALGGVAKFKGTFPSAGAEFRIAIAGPLVSLFLGLAFGALSLLPLVLEIKGVLRYVAFINLLVLGFNLVPALPLDGGRVLRSFLWARQKSFAAATKSAAKAGRAFGWLLIAVGVIGLLFDSGVGGIWSAFIGVFLLQAAQAEEQMAVITNSLRYVTISNLLTFPIVVPALTTLMQFSDDFVRRYGHSTYPVVDDTGRFLGLVTARKAATSEPHYTVADVMIPIQDVSIVDADSTAIDLVGALANEPGRAVVLDPEGLPIGIVSGTDVRRALEMAALSPPPEERPHPAPKWVWALVSVVMFLAINALFRPPLVVLAPGPAINVVDDITIEGIDLSEINGEYLLVSVEASQPSLYGLAVALIKGDAVIPLGSLIPPDSNPSDFLSEQKGLFEESRKSAAAAAAEALGMKVAVSGRGAVVRGTTPETPASERLEIDDVILSVDTQQVFLASDLTSAVQSKPRETIFALEVLRDSKVRPIEVRSVSLGEGTWGLGVEVTTRDLVFDFPFEIEFKDSEIGGPSAGLAYAMAIADLLDDRDLARGRTIAATGQISLDGQVGAVGGVEQKTQSALREDAVLFFVPQEDLGRAKGSRLQIIGASTLKDALARLSAA